MSKEVLNSTYWAIESTVSDSFNRVKAKLYNLVEASALNAEQSKATKGLIKGFLNDEYRTCVENLRFDAKNAGLIDDVTDGETLIPMGAEPLENAHRLQD